jgi:hypothetical protein
LLSTLSARGSYPHRQYVRWILPTRYNNLFTIIGQLENRLKKLDLVREILVKGAAILREQWAKKEGHLR